MKLKGPTMLTKFTTKKIIYVFVSILTVGSLQTAQADGGGDRLLYVASGKSSDAISAKARNEQAASIGFIKLSNNGQRQLGLDIGSEGTMLNNSSPKTATSFNLLLGSNFANSDYGRIDGSFLVGMREKSSYCPPSYLGYPCYANQDPTVKYSLNYGAVVTWSFKNVMVGIRATGESKQALLGFRF